MGLRLLTQLLTIKHRIFLFPVVLVVAFDFLGVNLELKVFSLVQSV